jgi:hypothetical protein
MKRVAVVEARRRRDPGAKELALVERERVRVAPRGGAEIAPPRIARLAVPAPLPVEVVVTRPQRVRAPRRPWSDERKRRFRRRFLPTAAALVLAPAPIARLLLGPSGAPVPAPMPVSPKPLPHLAPRTPLRTARGGYATEIMPQVVWHHSISLGLPYHGRLIDGVQLPVQSPYWVTWDPDFDHVPDRGYRRYGSAKLIHLLLKVTQEYHDAHPNAAKLVIGDLSRRGGGPLDQHASHQNGLDVDVYYPRKDQREVAPTTIGQVDIPLSQSLLNMFVEAGAEMVFVGPHLPQLHGPRDVVIPLVNHDNHMHVRIYPPS